MFKWTPASAGVTVISTRNFMKNMANKANLYQCAFTGVTQP
jgi:hypothetical protein